MENPILTIVQKVCASMALPQPTSLFAAPDAQTQQLLELANMVVLELTTRIKWQGTSVRFEYNIVVGEDQGSVYTITGDPLFDHFVPETIWNNTLRLPFYGPRTPQEWALLQAVPTSAPFYQYRIMGDHFHMYPPPDGSTPMVMAGEYVTGALILSASSAAQESFQADTDTFLLKDQLLQTGLRYKWKYEKGYPFDDDFALYERLIENYGTRQGDLPILDLTGPKHFLRPAILVPSGNWTVPNIEGSN